MHPTYLDSTPTTGAVEATDPNTHPGVIFAGRELQGFYTALVLSVSTMNPNAPPGYEGDARIAWELRRVGSREEAMRVTRGGLDTLKAFWKVGGGQQEQQRQQLSQTPVVNGSGSPFMNGTVMNQPPGTEFGHFFRIVCRSMMRRAGYALNGSSLGVNGSSSSVDNSPSRKRRSAEEKEALKKKRMGAFYDGGYWKRRQSNEGDGEVPDEEEEEGGADMRKDGEEQENGDGGDETAVNSDEDEGVMDPVEISKLVNLLEAQREEEAPLDNSAPIETKEEHQVNGNSKMEDGSEGEEDESRTENALDGEDAKLSPSTPHLNNGLDLDCDDTELDIFAGFLVSKPELLPSFMIDLRDWDAFRLLLRRHGVGLPIQNSTLNGVNLSSANSYVPFGFYGNQDLQHHNPRPSNTKKKKRPESWQELSTGEVRELLRAGWKGELWDPQGTGVTEHVLAGESTKIDDAEQEEVQMQTDSAPEDESVESLREALKERQQQWYSERKSLHTALWAADMQLGTLVTALKSAITQPKTTNTFKSPPPALKSSLSIKSTTSTLRPIRRKVSWSKETLERELEKEKEAEAVAAAAAAMSPIT
ncbi:hypothetical protein HK102_004393, partial [Quaeritorhiza haematococci]